MTVKTKVFKSNKTQAVRLPKAVAFPEEVTEVEIIVEGDNRIIRPIAKRMDWHAYFNGVPKVSDDFMTERDQGPPDKRPPGFLED